MDFDGDGIQDMISGSYDPGEFYLFRGEGNGKYKARETICDKNGKPVLRYPDQKQVWQSFGSWISTVDWDADGDLDLALGGFQGEILVRLNEGTPTNPEFAEKNFPVQVDGRDLAVPGSHATPVIADWDADRRWDILTGSETGAVYWYRNVGETASPRFEGPKQLVAARKGDGYDEFLDMDQEPVPGIRSQIDVTDYNGDGKLDLLVGDFCTTISPRPDLSPEERKKVLDIIREKDEVSARLREKIDTLREEFKKRYPGEELFSDEADKEFQEQYKAIRDSQDYKELRERYAELSKSLGAYLAKPKVASLGNDHATCRGYVWLFIRK